MSDEPRSGPVHRGLFGGHGRHYALVVVRVLVLLALLLASALTAVNIALDTWLPRLISAQPERLLVTWDVAWMIVPGKLEIRNLYIRAQSPLDQWELRANSASGDVDLFLLAERVFSVSNVHGSGGGFRYRVRRDNNVPGIVAAAASRVAPITGLQNPPDPDPEKVYPAPEDPWKLRFTDVTVDRVHELWLEDWHFLGDASAQGALVLTPGTWLEVRDVQITLNDGQGLLGPDPVLSHLKGDVTLAIPGLDLKETLGQSLFPYLTAGGNVTAHIRNLDFVDYYLGNLPWLHLGRTGSGTLDAEVRLARGKVLGRSHVSANVKDIGGNVFSYGVTGDGQVRIDVSEDAKTSTMVVDFKDYTITKKGDTSPHVRGEGFRVTATTHDVSLDQPFSRADVVLDLPDSDIRDVSVYNAYLPTQAGFTLVDGKGRARGKLYVSTVTNRAHGEMVLYGHDIRALFGDLSITGDVSLTVAVPDGRIDTGRYELSGSHVELANVSIVDGEGGGQHKRTNRGDSGWWAAGTLSDGHVRMGATEFLDAELGVRMRDTVPFLSIFAERKPLPEWSRDILTLRNLSGTGHVRLGDDHVLVPNLEVKTGDLEVRMALARLRNSTRGKLYARLGPLAIGMRIRDDEAVVRVLEPKKWYEAEPAIE